MRRIRTRDDLPTPDDRVASDTPWSEPAPKTEDETDNDPHGREAVRHLLVSLERHRPTAIIRTPQPMSYFDPIKVDYTDYSFSTWAFKLLGWVCLIGYMFWFFSDGS